MQPDITVIMWNRNVGVEFLPGIKDPTSSDFFGEVNLTIPDSLHQQLEENKWPRIIIKGKPAGIFTIDSYDPETDRHIYTTRFSYNPGDTILLMTGSLHTTFATWHTNKAGEAELVYSARS